MTIGGILYLHDISNKRFIGTARMNFIMFRHLCGGAAFDRVIIGTTNWGVDAFDRDQQHEGEMRVEHWSTLLEQGAVVRRFLRSSASAWDILNIFLQRADNARRLAQDVDSLRITTPVRKPFILGQMPQVDVSTHSNSSAANADPRYHTALDQGSVAELGQDLTSTLPRQRLSMSNSQPTSTEVESPVASVPVTAFKDLQTPGISFNPQPRNAVPDQGTTTGVGQDSRLVLSPQSQDPMLQPFPNVSFNYLFVNQLIHLQTLDLIEGRRVEQVSSSVDQNASQPCLNPL